MNGKWEAEKEKKRRRGETHKGGERVSLNKVNVRRAPQSCKEELISQEKTMTNNITGGK